VITLDSAVLIFPGGLKGHSINDEEEFPAAASDCSISPCQEFKRYAKREQYGIHLFWKMCDSKEFFKEKSHGKISHCRVTGA